MKAQVKKMKLKEYLESLPVNTSVSIGAASGYMYIGPCQNNDEIIHVFEKYCQKQKESYKNLMKLKRENKRNRGNKFVTKDMLERKKIYLKNYVPVMDREVTEVYDRIAVPAIAVILPGLEKGLL